MCPSATKARACPCGRSRSEVARRCPDLPILPIRRSAAAGERRTARSNKAESWLRERERDDRSSLNSSIIQTPHVPCFLAWCVAATIESGAGHTPS